MDGKIVAEILVSDNLAGGPKPAYLWEVRPLWTSFTRWERARRVP